MTSTVLLLSGPNLNLLGDRVEDHRKVLAAYDLPMDLPQGANAEQLLQLMQRDKKALDGLTFVLDGPRGVEVVKDVAPTTVTEVLRSMGAS